MSTLRILHFNDVYHVAASSQEPVGGAARFARLLKTVQERDGGGAQVTLFSGDAYFPSLESSVSHGRHMVPVLNRLGIDASTLGNHEFDQGLDQLERLIRDNNFPWVITNLVDRGTGAPAAAGCVPHLVKDVGGVRIGIIGIIEREWLDTLPCLPPTFEYRDFVESARAAARMLKDPGGHACDLVVCLSHMRLHNDLALADACGDAVDLVLGGHDHFYYVGSGIDAYEDPAAAQLPADYSGAQDDREMAAAWAAERRSLAGGRAGRRVVKSGTDFRDLSEIEVRLGADGAVARVSVTRHRATSSVPEDAEVKGMVDRIQAHLSKALDKVVGFAACDLDARSTACRTRESNLGSLSGDLMRLCYAESAGAQIGFLCGGTIRSDRILPAGQVTMRDITEVFPFESPVVVIRLTGDQIRRALENGVSKWPANEGRFPQVSGIRFAFDPFRPPGSRVTSIVLTAEARALARRSHSMAATGDSEAEEEEEDGDDDGADEPLVMDRHYVVATREYMYQGHDGYDAMVGAEAIVDDENGITFANLYERYFRGLAVYNALRFATGGYAQDCSRARHPAGAEEPGGQAERAESAWKRLIIKHADRLLALAHEARAEQAEAGGDDHDGADTAARIQAVIERFNGTVERQARVPRRRGARIIQALLSSATRLAAEQEPLRIARSALFGHEDNSSVPLAPAAEPQASEPRNDDAGGLLPGLLVNRRDTRSYASESLLARWAVISPQTDGRIRIIGHER
ncbi:hypothetical protein H4R18_001871 [Coemansia javaensis]|uniref:Metallo-dependent phosphatase n=1 Tax=Coemansia javaensis TaxID=2761396 RepID=A0A9W8LJZ3_9FUNG|nr:hypothetical protein H4R18_001871 [Coemansia javaensis]